MLGDHLSGEVREHAEGAPIVERDADHLTRIGHELDQRGTLAAAVGRFAASAFDQQPLGDQFADQVGDGRFGKPVSAASAARLSASPV